MDQFQSPERRLYLCQAPWTPPQSPACPSFSYKEKQSMSTFDGTQGPLSPLASKGQTLSSTADLLCDLRRFDRLLWAPTCPNYSHRQGGEGSPWVQVRTMSFLGNGPEALQGTSTGIPGERRARILSHCGAKTPRSKSQVASGARERAGTWSRACDVGLAHARGGGATGTWVEPRSFAAYSQLKVKHRSSVHQQRSAEGECGYLGRPQPRRALPPSL